MEFLYDILLDNGFKYKARGEETLALKAGDFCIIRKDFFKALRRTRDEHVK